MRALLNPYAAVTRPVVSAGVKGEHRFWQPARTWEHLPTVVFRSCVGSTEHPLYASLHFTETTRPADIAGGRLNRVSAEEPVILSALAHHHGVVESSPTLTQKSSAEG